MKGREEWEREFQEILEEYEKETEWFYQEKKEKLKEEFQNSFFNFLEKAERWQKEEKGEEIGYVVYTMLRTNLAKHNLNYVIKVYGKEWYFGKEAVDLGEYDSGAIFQHYERFVERLLRERKKYLGKIRESEIKRRALLEAERWNRYIAAIGRESILACLKEGALSRIQRADPFAIHIGEYLDRTYPIYKETKKRPTRDEMEKWGKEEGKLCFEDIRGIEAKEIEGEGSDLRYCDARGGDFQGANLERSQLREGRFAGCNFSYANLRGAQIEGCDFSYANFSQAVLRECEGKKGKKEGEERPGYGEVKFLFANLEGADFSYAQVEGGDFRGASLKGSRWEGTKVKGAKIEKKEKEGITLSKEQEEEIEWIEEGKNGLF